MQRLVRVTMLSTVGIEYDGRFTQFILPSPTDPPRLAPDGTNWWNPDWLAGLRNAEVKKFIKHVVALLLQNEASLADDKVSTAIV